MYRSHVAAYKRCGWNIRAAAGPSDDLAAVVP